MDIVPTFITRTEELILHQNVLLPSSSRPLLAGILPETRTVQAERTLFAFKVPFLPDSLSSQDLQAESNLERLAEVLDKQAQVVRNLGKWLGQAFCLRFMLRPERRQIEIQLLVRVLAQFGQAERQARRIATDLAHVYFGHQLVLDPVSSPSELTELIDCSSVPAVVEIRQHESIVPLTLGDIVAKQRGGREGAYVVCPFSPARSTWATLCKTLLVQQVPTLISVLLEPTTLFAQERKALTDAAATAERLSNFRYAGLAVEIAEPDPAAAMVGRLYTEMLARLDGAAFLATALVASAEPLAALTVAQAFGAEATREVGFDDAVEGRATLPAGFDLLVPRTPSEAIQAQEMLQLLHFNGWSHSESLNSPPGKERLRYLCDAHSAAAIFRFPVATKAGLPGIATHALPPDYYNDPALGERHGVFLLGRSADGKGQVFLPLQNISRHVLIAGINGSGKTTSCMQILSQLKQRNVNFLVIEPKEEYRGLLVAPFGRDVRVFTLGDETTSPFRFNPLEPVEGTSIERRVSSISACLQASLPQFGSYPALIEEALLEVYLDRDWQIDDYYSASDPRVLPTLGEFYNAFIRVAKKRGWSQNTFHDVLGAGAGRISGLLRGSKGRMLNVRRSIPIGYLMNHGVILETGALQPDERALVMLLLLTSIREYCKTTRRSSHLAHVTVIEEAHTVMARKPHVADLEARADSAAVVADMMSMLISQIRSAGEGIIIAEQIPGRLIEDALKNTNTKIVHKLPGEDDRAALGNATNMTGEQAAYVAKLQQGQAVVFTEGYERPSFVNVEDYIRQNNIPTHMERETLLTYVPVWADITASARYPFDGCAQCLAQCRYRERVASVVYYPAGAFRWQSIYSEYNEHLEKHGEAEAIRKLAQLCKQAIKELGPNADKHAAFCYYAHNWPFKIGSAFAQQFRNSFAE